MKIMINIITRKLGDNYYKKYGKRKFVFNIVYLFILFLNIYYF